MLFGISSLALYSQQILSGNLNQPKTHVVTIGVDRVTVDNTTGFAAGDTILLIQMQGVGILTGINDYGNIQAVFGQPGMHEFLIIQSVNDPEIVFKNNILEAYNPNGNIQIVRVPYFNSAIVTGPLFCDPWDPVAKAGGVLTFIIGRSLRLKADIDMTGRGFLGGSDVSGDGICALISPETTSKTYPLNFPNAGLKGEGLSIHDDVGSLLYPTHAKGSGPNYTGGGGGNGRFSGGGGGSNRGSGGIGGQEDNLCVGPQPGGLGGYESERASFPSLINRIYMGGGGGASTSLTGLSASGGNGGGIVIVVTDTIIGNGGNIISNGGNGGTAVANGGAGGGGAGGSIALSTNSYGTSSFLLSAAGGNGGNNPGVFGEGGGGGGGFLYISTDISGNVRDSLSGGLPGNDPASTALPGDVGEKRLGFKAILNGFLFNSIRSSVTGNQVDSVCSNMIPPRISGTIPVGGTAPYTYLWEKSYDEISWIPLTNDADPINYTPTIDDTTTTTGIVYFRRTITDFTTLPDVSKSVKVIVQPFIKNNIVGTSDTICFAQDPPAFTSKAALQNGNGTYSFFWEVSMDPDSALFGLPVNANNAESYTAPPALETTSWYRRTVISGRCVDSSATAVAKITVLPVISSNTISSLPEEICFGSSFADLVANDSPALSGGDETFRFRWESNINGSGWGVAPGTNDQPGYNPGELAQKIPFNEYYFRRVVLSGSNDVCVNTSNTILLKDYPVISNNTISPLTQTIGFDSIPAVLTGSVPLNGDGSYTYKWEGMTVSPTWNISPGTNDQIDYSPPSLQDTTWYRRIVQSSACKDTSNLVVVNVHDLIINNTIAFTSGAVEDTICSGSVPEIIKGSTPSGGAGIAEGYSYKWYSSISGGLAESEWSEISGESSIDFQSVALTQHPTYFRRKVFSPALAPTAISTSNSIKITVLPLISNIISGSDTICYGLAPALLQNAVLSGGDGSYTYAWIDSTDATGWTGPQIPGAIVSEYQPPNLFLPASYRRIVYSGSNDCCIDTSNSVTINIHDLPTVTITNTNDTTLCTDSKVQLKLKLTGRPGFTIDYNDGLASDVSGILVPASNGLIEISPASPLASNNYTYKITKVVDKNGCEATSITGEKKALVYQTPVADAGPDDIVCGQTVTLNANPTVGTGSWSYPSQLIAASVNAPTVTVTVDSLYNGASIAHWFYWEEINWQCKNKDSVQITFDKRINTINAGNDTTFYSFVNDIQMSGDPLPLLVGTGNWTVESGTGTPDDPANGSTIMRGLSAGTNIFKWKVVNGLCENMDLVNINVLDIFIPQGFSPDNDPGDFNNTFRISGLDLNSMDADLTIMNSAGAIVFSAISINGGGWTEWDGKNSSGYDLSEGTYYYRLTLKSTISPGTAPDIRSGFIVLRRKY